MGSIVRTDAATDVSLDQTGMTMSFDTPAIPQQNSSTTPRYDIYRGIHKAVRAFMCDTLLAVGRLDAADRHEAATTVRQVRSMATFCASHLAHEDRFIHPAMEERRPGSADNLVEDHRHHGVRLQEIGQLADRLEQAADSAALEQLQRLLADFTADSLQHMNIEETWNNAVLWDTHTDAELLAIEQAIVASIPADEMMLCLRWMMIGSSPTERAELLGGMRQNAPRPAYEAALALARDCLDARDWNRLAQALEESEPLAA